jgi:RNA polymerase sigma-70 factor (ECF subfamily)
MFGAIFDRHFTTVFSVCARRVGHDLAEDLAGETFRRAFEHRRRYDPNEPDARGWLVSIALNLVRDTVRSSVRQESAYRRFVLQCEPSVDPGAEVAASMDGCRDVRAVFAVLEHCPTEEVEALLLHVWDGLTYSEVAVALDIPLGTVRSRLNRLRARLRASAPSQQSSRQDHRCPRPISPTVGS